MSSLTGQFSHGIKQRQRFGRFLDGLAGLRDNLAFSENTIKGVCEKFGLQITVAYPVNGQLGRCGVIVNFLDDIQADLLGCGDLCHVLPLCDVGSIIEATLKNGSCNALAAVLHS